MPARPSASARSANGLRAMPGQRLVAVLGTAAGHEHDRRMRAGSAGHGERARERHLRGATREGHVLLRVADAAGQRASAPVRGARARPRRAGTPWLARSSPLQSASTPAARCRSSPSLRPGPGLRRRPRPVGTWYSCHVEPGHRASGSRPASGHVGEAELGQQRRPELASGSRGADWSASSVGSAASPLRARIPMPATSQPTGATEAEAVGGSGDGLEHHGPDRRTPGRRLRRRPATDSSSDEQRWNGRPPATVRWSMDARVPRLARARGPAARTPTPVRRSADQHVRRSRPIPTRRPRVRLPSTSRPATGIPRHASDEPSRPSGDRPTVRHPAGPARPQPAAPRMSAP